MLYNIISSKSKCFQACIESVKKAYWPYEELLGKLGELDEENEIKKILDCIAGTFKDKAQFDKYSEFEIKIKKDINKLIETVCNQGLYTPIGESGNKRESIHLPFVNKFHELFLERKYNIPYSEYKYGIEDIFRLHEKKGIGFHNYSKNGGNYNHFVNVVAALAHLIFFFRKVKSTTSYSKTYKEIFEEYLMENPEDICFDEVPNRRTLKLMLAGFFHDIGKTVVDHRHAMEGGIILSSYKSKDLYQFGNLSKELAPKSEKPKNGEDPFLDRDDLLFIADLIDYHDLFGTLSTGENGYMRFVNLIERIERYIRRRKRKQDSKHISEEDIKEIKKGGKEFLFDVWLLNVADIIVSREKKYEVQEDWQSVPPGSVDSKEKIESFFNSSDNVANIQQGRDLLHDLKIAFIIFNTHIEEIFDTYTKSKKREYFKSSISIKKAANKCSYDHIIGRIRRIVKASLFTEIEGQKKRIEDGIEKTGENLKVSKNRLEDFFDKLKGTKIYQLDGIIETSIKCSTNYSEFLNSLSWIGQLDYSLGFFKKIAERSLYRVGKQIINTKYTESTGWINDNYENISEYLKEGDDEDLNKINSKYFLDNYVSLIVKILSYLLCKKEPIDEMINIEFEDAAKRLTEDKIDEISVFEGPARASKTTMSILNRVFLYYLN